MQIITPGIKNEPEKKWFINRSIHCPACTCIFKIETINDVLEKSDASINCNCPFCCRLLVIKNDKKLFNNTMVDLFGENNIFDQIFGTIKK